MTSTWLNTFKEKFFESLYANENHHNGFYLNETSIGTELSYM